MDLGGALMKAVKDLWKNFVENQSIEFDQLKTDILNSWKRCKTYEVSPYEKIDIQYILNPKDKYLYTIDNQASESLIEFEALVTSLNMSISIYDHNCQLQYIFNFPQSFEGLYPDNGFLINASENTVGTNSTCVALYEKRPSMVIGFEHYNYTFHTSSCAAAPLLDAEGCIIGTVNASFLHTSINHDTLNLVCSLARYYERTVLNHNRKISSFNNPRHQSESQLDFNGIIGTSDAIVSAKAIAKKAAQVDSHILIYGESGSGKEIFAQAIHSNSARGSLPFVAINCAAIPNDLIESELFGYEAGAFTGANKKGKQGLLEYASGGTLFLDEIESMSHSVQVKILRALSTASIKRIGGLKPIPIDIRIISASKIDLLEEVSNGRFREDLFYRINIIQLNLPSLRECKSDIPLIFNNYLQKLSAQMMIHVQHVTPLFLEYLMAFNWPGNVRQLINITERALVFSEEGCIKETMLPLEFKEAFIRIQLKEHLNQIFDTSFSKEKNLLEIAEEVIIERILKEEGGNISKSAERLGMSRPTLYKKIKNSNLKV